VRLEFERVIFVVTPKRSFLKTSRRRGGCFSLDTRGLSVLAYVYLVIGHYVSRGAPRVTRLSLRNVNGCFTFQLPRSARASINPLARNKGTIVTRRFTISLCICFRYVDADGRSCVTSVYRRCDRAAARFVIRRADAILRRRNSCSYLLCNPSSPSLTRQLANVITGKGNNSCNGFSFC